MALLKTGMITTASDLGCPPMETLPLGRGGIDRGWLRRMRKSGSGALAEKIRNLEPREGHTAIYMIPISAYEVTGFNRNGDGWPETATNVWVRDPKQGGRKVIDIKEGLMERSDTFVTHAKMYRDHKNDDPEKASGDIVACDYRRSMGRPEAISFVSNDVWDDDLHRLAGGNNIGVSMSARVPFDFCDVCGNRARRRSQYCRHILCHMNKILTDGTQVGVINERPTFFDVSGVRFNADRLGYGLWVLGDVPRKSAGADLRARRDLVRKLAAMEKELTPEVCSNASRAVDPRLMRRPSDVTITIMKSYDPGIVGSELKKRRIVLDPASYMRVVSDAKPEESDRMAGRMRSILPGLFGSMLGQPADGLPCLMEPRPTSLVAPGLSAAVSRIAPELSLDPEHLQGRMRISIKTFDDEPEVGCEQKAASGGEVDQKVRDAANEYGKYLLAMADGQKSAEFEAAMLVSKRLLAQNPSIPDYVA